MKVAILEPEEGYACRAARKHFAGSDISVYITADDFFHAVESGQAQRGVVRAYDPKNQAVYGTFERLASMKKGCHILEHIVSSEPEEDRRLAVIGEGMAERTGYDSTYVVFTKLRDKIGLLHSILGVFRKQGINLADVHKTWDRGDLLNFYLEFDGYAKDSNVQQALREVGEGIIHNMYQVRILGSYPRVGISKKLIERVGFIGRRSMAQWYKSWLGQEGIQTELTGTDSDIEGMIGRNQVIGVCVPITVTAEVIRKYAPHLKEGQALVDFSGEKEENLRVALECARPGVEVGGIHTLWGPAMDIKSLRGKKVEVVRTPRSGPMFGELVDLFYKYDARIHEVTAEQQDAMMGITQKMPQAAVVAFVYALRESGADFEEVLNHTTPTSDMLFDLAGRMHSQSLAVYPDIIASNRQGDRMLEVFAKCSEEVRQAAARGDVKRLREIMSANQEFLGPGFMKAARDRTKEYDRLTAEEEQ